jgi:aldehyde:ferredoxin oxidoreductase
LGSGNRLIIAPGLLSGTNCINSGRLSIGAKSPLTGTIKESNVGGTAAQSLGKLNIAGIILENKPAGDKLQYILVNKEGAQLLPADDLKGLKNYEVVNRLREKHGEIVRVISIGPAGENRFSSASIAVADKEGRASRHAGRGGMGAVMGSKGIKAIVIDGTDAPGVEYHDSEAFKEAAKVFRGVIMESDSTKPNTGELAMYSMNAIMAPVNAIGAFPTRNFSQGQFEGVEKIDGEALHNTIKERGGIYNHAGCSQCIIQCSNVYVDKEKNYITSALEYETIWALGANCGIDNLDAIAQMDRLCDEYGIDTIETGGAIAVAMEAGVKSFGDYDGAIELIHEIGQGTPMERITPPVLLPCWMKMIRIRKGKLRHPWICRYLSHLWMRRVFV